MRMTKKEYKDYTNSIAPKSPLGRNLFHAFWVGGLICCLGQFLQNGFSAMGLEKTMAGTAASCSLVFCPLCSQGFPSMITLQNLPVPEHSCQSPDFPTRLPRPPSNFNPKAGLQEWLSKCLPLPVLFWFTAQRQASSTA